MLGRDHGKLFLACAGAALLTLSAGCTGSSSVSPTVTPASRFSPLPLGPISGTTKYTTIFGPVTGKGSKSFTVSVRPSYILWLGCLGKGGNAEIKIAMAGPDPAMLCGSSGIMSGFDLDMARASTGRVTTVQVIAPRTAKWELRIDGGQKAS